MICHIRVIGKKDNLLTEWSIGQYSTITYVDLPKHDVFAKCFLDGKRVYLEEDNPLWPRWPHLSMTTILSDEETELFKMMVRYDRLKRAWTPVLQKIEEGLTVKELTDWLRVTVIVEECKGHKERF